MSKTEMLNKLLAQSGWVVTSEIDEEGRAICKAEKTAEE